VKPVLAMLIAGMAGVVTVVVARWLVAVPMFWAVIIALPVAAFTLPATLLAGVASPTWQALPTPDDSLNTHQASSLSGRLAEAALDQRRFRVRVQPRLSRLALSTLRNRPGMQDLTSLDDDRARSALGTELHTLLTDRNARLPQPRRLAELLDRLEGQ
jgi:hypothetical protein